MKIKFQAVTPFGTFIRVSDRDYVACVAREDGWHQFSMSRTAALKELHYQQRKGRNVVLVPVSAALASVDSEIEDLCHDLRRALAQKRVTKEAVGELLAASPASTPRALYAQLREPGTYVEPIVGNKREWNIVTETGGRLERFEGTKCAADKRAAELHRNRFPEPTTRQ